MSNYMIFDDTRYYKDYLNLLHSDEYVQLTKMFQKKTLMDILGVSRQENPHSSFLSWLLNRNEDHELGEFPIRRFIETICFAYKKYGDYLKPTDLNKALFDSETNIYENLKHFLLFYNWGEDDRKRDEKDSLIRLLMSGKYTITSLTVTREKSFEARRADIWIDMDIQSDLIKCKLYILIENKVTSKENDNQTQKYVKLVTEKLYKENEKQYFIPIYLFPCKNQEINQHIKKLPFVCNMFLILNYQYILDGVLEPSLRKSDIEEISGRIEDYITCLGQSIFDQGDDDKSTVLSCNRNIIMAVSQNAKSLVSQIWEKYEYVLKEIWLSLREADSPYIASDSERQFYLTVFSIVCDVSQDNKYEVKDEFREILDAEFEDRRIYTLMGQDKKEHTFKSGGGRGKNQAAFAYYLLKQFGKLNIRNDSPLSASDIREKLQKKIKNKWTSTIFATETEFQQLMNQWKVVHDKKVHDKKFENVCSCYSSQGENGEPICPLQESKNSPFSNRYDGEISAKEAYNRMTCPLFMSQNISDGQLRKAYFGKLSKEYDGIINNEVAEVKVDIAERGIGFSCIYDMIHCCYVSEILGEDIYINEKDNIESMGLNTMFSKIPISKNENVYVVRWWFGRNIDQLIEVLDGLLENDKISNYCSINSAAPAKCVDFEIQEP